MYIKWFEPRNELLAAVAELALPPHKRQYVTLAQARVRIPVRTSRTSNADRLLFLVSNSSQLRFFF
jgi:hypothetical protein